MRCQAGKDYAWTTLELKGRSIQPIEPSPSCRIVFDEQGVRLSNRSRANAKVNRL
jgi:hypothetical protein